MQLPPASVLSSWPPGNFEHPAQVRGPGIIILVGIFLPIMISVVVARSYTRFHIVRSFGLDDAFILAALFPALCLAFVAVYSTEALGWKMHAWDLGMRPDLLSLGLKYFVLVEILFSLTASCTKVSMLLFTRRIIEGAMPKLRLATNMTMAIVVAENMIFIFVVIFTCRPVSDYWALSSEPQHCLNETAHVVTASCINTVTDFLVVMLPIPLALNLNIPPKQKLCLVLLFSSGFMVCCAGVFRIYYTYIYFMSHDRSWMALPTWLASLTELYLGLITASLPGIKPLVTKFLIETTQHKASTVNHIDCPANQDIKPTPKDEKRELAVSSRRRESYWPNWTSADSLRRASFEVDIENHSRGKYRSKRDGIVGFSETTKALHVEL